MAMDRARGNPGARGRQIIRPKTRRARIFELAEALFQSIRMQLSVRAVQGHLGRTAAQRSTPSTLR